MGKRAGAAARCPPTGGEPTRPDTGQRLDSYTQLYHMGARWYDPVLARWTSPDSVVPDLSDSQAWNRYSYVYHNPQRYVDRDGHTPLLVTALIGAGIGATVNTVQQVIAIQRANPGQVSLGDALRQVNPGEVLGAAAAGGVMGLTLGVGSAVIGTGVAATAFAGAVGGGLGGQVDALTQASWAEAVQMMNGAGLDGERFLTFAQQSGFLDMEKFGLDCWAGGISAGAGRVVTGFLGRFLNIPVPKDPNVMREIVRFDPQGKMMYVVSTDFSKTLVMPIDAYEQWARYLSTGIYEYSKGYLEELIPSGVAQWLENQTQ